MFDGCYCLLDDCVTICYICYTHAHGHKSVCSSLLLSSYARGIHCHDYMMYADSRNIMVVMFGSVKLTITCHDTYCMLYLVFIPSKDYL